MPTAAAAVSRLAVLTSAALLAMGAGGSPAHAQELVQTFRDPAFGGNPFNGDYLLAIANLSRPEAPKEPVETPSEEELLALQIKSQLTSSLSLTVLNAIRTAKVGQSGTFTFGDQQISYVREVAGTRVKFKNTKTGEESEIFVPEAGSTGTGLAAAASGNESINSLAAVRSGQAVSAEAALASGEIALLGLPPL